jgi:hypothetical protein
VNELSYAHPDLPADGWAPHIRVGLFAVLFPLLLGFAVLAAWVWLGGMGILLALALDIAALVLWRRRKGATFPPDLTIIELAIMLLITGGLGALAFTA